MSFRWDRIENQPDFDAAVELLLTAEWSDRAQRAWAPDGRGGDGGRDFVVELAPDAPEPLRIFQLKFYPDGFRTSRQSRRRKVSESFDRALEHEPDVWSLVVPAKLTPGDHEFVRDLAERSRAAGAKVPRITVVDLNSLTHLTARNPEVERYLERDAVMEALDKYQHLQSVLPRDAEGVSERAEIIVSQGSDLDPDWAMEIFTLNGKAYPVPRLKPGARPGASIGLNITLSGAYLTTDQAAVIERSLGYGSGETVTIPQGAIASLEPVGGPSWWKPQDEPGDLLLMPADRPTPDAVLTLDLLTESGTVEESYEGQVEHVGAQVLGMSLTAVFLGGVSLQILMPQDRETPGKMHATVDIHRLSPADARDSLRMYRLLLSAAYDIRVTLNGASFIARPDAAAASRPDTSMLVLEQFADDFDALVSRTGKRRLMPAEVPALDRALARMARIVLDGSCALLPPQATFSGTIETGGDPAHLSQLRSQLEQPRTVVIRRDPVGVRICGVDISLGPVIVYGPEVRVRDANRLLALLEHGQVDGEKITLEPSIEHGWRIAPLGFDDEVTDHQLLNPRPWAGVDLPEHPALAKIQASYPPNGGSAGGAGTGPARVNAD